VLQHRAGYIWIVQAFGADRPRHIIEHVLSFFKTGREKPLVEGGPDISLLYSRAYVWQAVRGLEFRAKSLSTVEAFQSAPAVLEGKGPDEIVNPEISTHPHWQKFS